MAKHTAVFAMLLLLFYLSSYFAVIVNRETQAFIQAMLQREGVCAVTEPIRAFPRGDYLRNALGNTCEGFLVPDILFWDPTLYFSGLVLRCPSCEEQGLFEQLHPIRWKDGSRTYDQPRQLYGLRNDVLLVSRVYLCKNKHQILSHDSGIICQIKGEFLPPFVLCHKVGVTREMFQFVTSHVRAGMTISDIQILWQQTLFDEYGLRKLFYFQETGNNTVEFPIFSPKGRKVGEKIITACYIQSYFEREHLFTARMCQMKASSLSADHTFKVSSNIGFWCNGKWVRLYDSLFIVMNEAGVVMSWQLCKGTSFSAVEGLLHRLKDRLVTLGCSIGQFHIDNCCQWRAKLQSVFGNDTSVKLDLFHAIQRFTSKIPRKGGRGSALRKLRSRLISNFKLIIRDPTDQGKTRKKPTPCKDTIEKNIKTFLEQWKDVDYEGMQLVPQCALDEIDKLLLHVRKGCLSHIPPTGGTSRNEGIHRVLNKSLKKSRIGIQFAIALLGAFFYIWNEKQLSGEQTRKKIRVVPPIESHFKTVDNSYIEERSEHFGVMDIGDFTTTQTDGDSAYDSACSNDSGSLESSSADIVDKLNEYLQYNESPDSSSDEEESFSIASTSNNVPVSLSEEQMHSILTSSKSMQELCSYIQEAGQFGRFDPNIVTFVKSTLTLLHSKFSSQRNSTSLDDILANYSMHRVLISPNGNCFFLAIAYALRHEIPKQPDSEEILQHLASLGLESCSSGEDVCVKLRKLMFDEWMTHPDLYQHFLTGEQIFESEAKLFLNNGHFATDLGNAMPLAMANALKLPIVIFTEMENMPVLPITPRETIKCMPIFLTFDQSGPGHYDAVEMPLSKCTQPSKDIPKKVIEPSTDDSCRCGQGTKKDKKDTISCDVFKKRCKCFQGIRGCTNRCRCLGCANPYGKNNGERQRSNSITGTRKRRAPQMSSEIMSGKDFMSKKPNPGVNSQWTFFEELVLVQLIQLQFSENDIDMAAVHFQFNQLRDTKYVHPKTPQQITRKVVSFLTENEVFKTIFKEQIRLNWFR